jgi:kinesin family protein 5
MAYFGCFCWTLFQVNVKRTVYGRQDKESALSNENGNGVNLLKGIRAPVVRKSKLVVVDLAGSERIDKSGTR